MAKSFKPQPGDLVVMNRRPDAALFRVREVNGFSVTVVDSEIEDQNPLEQHVDLALCKKPTALQLKQLKQ
jgi:hypothetical protein